MSIRKLLATIVVTGAAAGPAVAGDAEHGRYLVTIMDCQGCHSGRLADGTLDPDAHLTGGVVGFELPGLGVFYPPNLTPDRETGLGTWSDAEIGTAIRTGERPDGRILAPIMPWMSYAVLSDADLADVIAYLRTLPPAANRVPGPYGPGESIPAPYLAMLMPERLN